MFIYKEEDTISVHTTKPEILKKIPASTYIMSYDERGFPVLTEQSPKNDPPIELQSNSKEIVKEIDNFFAKREMFEKMKVNHKRGYLLYGPPGTGKSATLRLLQNQFNEKFDGAVLIWVGGSFKNHYDLIKKTDPNKPVMVICEDIDRLMVDFESYVLELLDGQGGLNNFVLVATTNYLDRIPARIKNRPSRIDRLVKIDFPSASERMLYLKHLKVEEGLSNKIVELSDSLSIAHLKEIVIAHSVLGQDLTEVIERIRGIEADTFESEKKNKKRGLFPSAGMAMPVIGKYED